MLYLGAIPVGRIAHSGGRNNKPRWIFNLAMHRAFWATEKTSEAAVFALVSALTGWLRDAGLLPEIIAALERVEGKA